MFQIDMLGSLGCAAGALALGRVLRARLPALARHNVPAPVVGGLALALGVAAARAGGLEPPRFDTTLQVPLMVAFFTAIGFGASVRLLRAGGRAVVACLALATVLAVLQNLLGGAVAALLGAPPLLGVIAGALTLAGGPATGLAFAPLFEEAGVRGASTLAIASAMAGIVAAGLVGAPLATWLVERRRLSTPSAGARLAASGPAEVERAVDGAADARPGAALLEAAVAIALAMGAGAAVSRAVAAAGVTLPGYIGAMVVAAALRGLDDATGRLRLRHAQIAELGHVSLALFLGMALASLRLWELAGLALPLVAILGAQVVLACAFCLWPTFRLLGSDYEAAVATSGFCGFMLGTTANAMANMDALAERYGPAPRAYLAVPMVGGFFVDFTNALVITAFLNWWR